MQNTPVAQDTSAHTHALALEAALGGPDLMAVRVGTCAHASLLAAQLLRVREAWPEVWARTGKVQVASSFVASLICGAYVGMGEAEACATGLWAHSGPQPAGTPSHWDEGVLEIVGGSRDEGRRIWGWLGDVDISGGRRRIGIVSRYLVDRYGFDPGTYCLSSLATDADHWPRQRLSLRLSRLITSQHTSHYAPHPPTLCSPLDRWMHCSRRQLITYPPACTPSSPTPRRTLESDGDMFSCSPAGMQMCPGRSCVICTPRVGVHSTVWSPSCLLGGQLGTHHAAFLWSLIDQLVDNRLDDKLFSFWLLQGDSYPFSHVKGIFRFETGVKVNEFRDLRANPRCLLESQVLSFRIRWSRMLSTGVLGPNAGRGRAANASPSPVTQQKRGPTGAANYAGLPFDPYDYTPLPTRILSTGAAANFPSISNLVGDIFNAPVLVPTTQIDGAQVVPHRNAPPQGFPARAALGGAYVARWVWGKEKGTPAGTGRGGFEEEVRRLLAKRWGASGGAPLRTSINAPGASSKAPSAAGSGASTPYGHGARSALGATILVEEDEDEQEDIVGVFGAGSAFGEGELSRLRTVTGSTTGTTMSGSTLDGPSTAFTTPDLGGTTPTGETAPDPAAQSSPPSLVPVTAMPTSDAELQLGLAKVAEPDVDAFMSYAAIVPEYCRLEGLLIKSLV